MINSETSFSLQGETFSVGETVFFNDDVLTKETDKSWKIGDTVDGFCIGCDDFYSESMQPTVFENYAILVGFGNKYSKLSGNIFSVSLKIKYGNPLDKFRYRVIEVPYWFIVSKGMYENGRGKRLEKKLEI